MFLSWILGRWILACLIPLLNSGSLDSTAGFSLIGCFLVASWLVGSWLAGSWLAGSCLAGSRLVSADVVEVAPAYDHAELTSTAAATIVYELVNLIARSPK